MIKNIKWLLLVSLTFVACNDDDETTVGEVPITAGSANFTKYVALGNSITAGYTDGALFVAGQNNAYPKLMADQFALAGGGAFIIPYMSDNVGGIVGVPGVGPRLIFNGTAPVPLPGGVSTTPLLPALTGPFNNMGVPGAKSFHLLAPAYGNPAGLGTTANPYFVRFASSTSTSVIADAMTQQPTFFSLWIGNNDVLGYATTGGDGTNPITPVTGAPGVGFDGTYNALVETLTSNGAKGVVANIPYVSTIPFFTTVPTDPIPPFTPATAGNAALLNQLFGAINQIAAAAGQPARFGVITVDDGNTQTIEANNPLLIKDESLTNFSVQITNALTPMIGATQAGFVGALYGQARHASKDVDHKDYILLTTRTVIGTPQAGYPSPFNINGVSFPLQDNRVLTETEALEIKVATDSYNATILAAANAKGLAFVDANAVMNQLANGGIRFENFHFTSVFVQGGAFGLDGVHLTGRANAYIANKFLESINAKYGSTLRMYKPQNFVMSYPAFLP